MDKILQSIEQALQGPMRWDDIDLCFWQLNWAADLPEWARDLTYSFAHNGGTKGELRHLVASLRAGHYLTGE